MSGMGRCSISVGRINPSRTLMAGHSRDIGRYEEESSDGFFDFRRGIITEDFQIAGIVLVFSEILKISVK